MKKRCLTLILSGLISAGAIADTVNESNVTTFQAGTPAVAAQVNTTIQALITAINDNATRIAALEEAAPSNSVVGKTYSLKQIGVLFRGNNTDYATVGNTSQTYTLTLNANMSFTLVGSENEGEVGITGNTIAFCNGDCPVDETGTYSQTGSVVTLTFGDASTAEFTVANNASVVILSEFTYGTEDDMPAYTRTESSLVVGVETTSGL